MNFIIGALIVIILTGIISGIIQSIWNFTKKTVKRIFGVWGLNNLIIITNLIGLILVFYFVHLMAIG